MATHVQGLTEEQRRALDERGLVRLPGVIPRADARAMADRIWTDLARRYRTRRTDPRTWQTERPSDFEALRASGGFKAMGSPQLVAVLDDLLGRERWARPRQWGLPLVCFPRSYGRWDVTHQSWHLDLPVHPTRHGAKIGRVFAILAPLAAKGDGTLIATGSHRIVEALVDELGFEHSSGDVRKRLKTRHRWFAGLMSSKRDRERIARFMDTPTEVDGIPVQVREITGEPGDVFLMHPAALHAAAPNVLDTPRLMLAQFILPKT